MMYNSNLNLEVEDPKFEIENSDKPVLVDVFATWCGPCKMLSPIIQNIAKKYENDIKVIKVDIDKHREFANEYNIRSIPTMLFFKNGEVVRKEMGFKPENQISKMIEESLMPKSDDIRNEIKNSKGAVLVDFYTDWCGYCKKLEPVLKKVKEKYGSDLKIIKVNAERYSDLADEYEIDGYPTMKLFYDGKLVTTIDGFRNEDAICKVIDNDLLSKKK